VATADAYVLAPSLLGPLRADGRRWRDRFSAGYLLARAQRLIGDVAAVLRQAGRKRVATLTIDADVRFRNAMQRKRFGLALQRAVERVVKNHTEPGTGGRGRPYRLVIACHPAPGKEEE